MGRRDDVFDANFNRDIELEAVSTDVGIELYPKEHALAIHGRFCKERVDLAKSAWTWQS